jgi:hypothetical protein
MFLAFLGFVSRNYQNISDPGIYVNIDITLAGALGHSERPGGRKSAAPLAAGMPIMA